MHNVLYLSYDGLLDPLGKSQILPYIKGIATHQKQVHIISFEKKKRIMKEGKILFKEKNIFWHHLIFTSNFGLAGKIWDILKLFLYTLFICKKKSINLIHARSHIAAYVGYFIKKVHKLKLIFDFRGLWLEERFENNLWNKNSVFYLIMFKILKKMEKKVIFSSSKLVVLTEKLKKEFNNKFNKRIISTVIPCAVDYKLFNYNKFIKQKDFIKKEIGINKKDLIICYLGSLGGVYNVENVLNSFLFIKRNYEKSSFLIITNNPEVLEEKLKRYKYSELRKKLKYFFKEREFLPKYLSIADIGINFIQPGYSRLAQSPTRIGEFLSMGVPVICNKHIGDLETIIPNLNAGTVIDINLNQKNINILKSVNFLKNHNKHLIRMKSKKIYSLDNANKKYKKLYQNI